MSLCPHKRLYARHSATVADTGTEGQCGLTGINVLFYGFIYYTVALISTILKSKQKPYSLN